VPDNLTHCQRGVLIDQRYELVAVVGVGGMGEVWRAHDRRLGRTVAIKLLPAGVANRPGARRRLAAEARAACVNHPHVVAVYDFGDEPTPCIVMELLDGRTLADDLAQGPLTNAEARILGDQVLDALAAAHARGLLHRDLKPGNVLWAGPSTWKVADFGISASIPSSRADDTTVPMMGTHGYMSPERLTGAPPSVTDDLFAVGALLRAAAGDDADASLRATITRATSIRPADRFASAEEMRAALRGGAGDHAPEPTRVLPAVAAPVPPTGHRRHGRGVAVLAVALAVAGVFGLIEHGHDGGNATPPATTAGTTAPPTTVAPVTTAAPAPAPPPTKAPGPGQDPKGHKRHHPPHGDEGG
jgi:Protein kinase domain